MATQNIEQEAVVGLIPVFRRGNEVADWAIVDEDTYLWARQYRWRMDGMGYAMRSHRLAHAPLNRHGQRPAVRIAMHRDLKNLGYGDKRVVDHINGDKLDNRLANLRVLTLAENGQNKPSYKDSTSKHRGVHWYPPRDQWRVAVMVDGIRTVVGYFDDEDEAGAAAEAFYRANAPLRRQELVPAVQRPRGDNSGKVEPHLVTVKQEALALKE